MSESLTILIVDDDSLDRLALSRALHHAGFDVLLSEAQTCAEARELLCQQAFDAVFLDYSLPDGTALELIPQVQAMGVKCPLIVLTGQGDELLARALLKAGADDYLPKLHMNPVELERCLRSALRCTAAVQTAHEAQANLLVRDRAINAARNGIIIADAQQADCPVIYCNKAFEKVTGYAAHEAIGRNCRFLQGSDSDPAASAEMRQAIKAGTPCHVVIKNYRKDGTSFWNEVTLAPVHDAQGVLSHFIGVQTDISALKWAEEERLRLLELSQEGLRRERTFLRDVLSSVSGGKLRLCESPADLPRPLSQTANAVSLSAPGGVRELRRHAERAGELCRFSDARSGDLAAAVGEAAMNAMVHGGGGMGRVHTDMDNSCVQVWIEDQGKGIALENLPRATLERGYTTAGTLGHGFWIVLRTTDRLWLLTSPEGTTVVLEHAREAPGTNWLGVH